MTDEVMDWDSAYREQGAFEGPPPWNIGEPQPELATLIAAGKVRSDVLDAGCGYAELSLALAADGYTVVGIDLTPTAVAAATKAAEERGLTTASFVQADITEFAAYPAGSAGRFSTVIDLRSDPRWRNASSSIRVFSEVPLPNSTKVSARQAEATSADLARRISASARVG